MPKTEMNKCPSSGWQLAAPLQAFPGPESCGVILTIFPNPKSKNDHTIVKLMICRWKSTIRTRETELPWPRKLILIEGSFSGHLQKTLVAHIVRKQLFALRISQECSYDIRSLKYSSNKTLVTMQNCYLNYPLIWCLVSLAKTWLSMVDLTFMICMIAGFENWFGAFGS